jgi:hypothetical protein
VPVRPPSKTPSLAVLAAILALGGCGGRASGLLGVGSGSNDGGPSGNVTGTPEGSIGESQPEPSVADSPSSTGTEGSSGNPVTILDAGTDATGAGTGSVDATGGLEASSARIDATDATETDADVVVPCGPPSAGTYFVDPVAGHDDDGGTGSQSCPYKSLAHALSLVGDAGAPVTVEIVNMNAAPTLSQSTGEVFPITVPGGVTIIAEDTTKNTPTVEVTPSQGPFSSQVQSAAAEAVPAGTAIGFYLGGAGARLSHLVVSGPGQTQSGRDEGVILGAGGEVIDHVTVQNFKGFVGAIVVTELANADAGAPVIGPGVVAIGNGQAGLHIAEGSPVVIGGQGADHTAFEANNFGIYVWGGPATLIVQGTSIDPAHPDQNDVDVDNNSIGLFLQNSSIATPSNVRGLHIAGNSYVGILCAIPLTLRGSYIANNQAGGFQVDGPTPNGIDIGNPVGSDYGRNIFVGNTGGDICGASAQQPVLAAGNIFGTIDCAVGGKLDPR